MKTIRNISERIATTDNFIAGYRNYVTDKPYRSDIKAYESNLAANVKTQIRAFRTGEWKVPEYEDEGTVTVADYALWLAMEDDYNNEDENAHGIDNEVFAYVRPGYLESNPTDDELRSYLNEILN